MSSAPTAFCREDRQRREDVRASGLNGLDYLEVSEKDRHLLTVYFIAKLRGLGAKLGPESFVICGGVRVTDIKVTHVTVCERPDPDTDDCLTLTVDQIGDLSPYCLRVIHPEFDPIYASLDFTFQAGCPSTSDCAVEEVCPEPPRTQPAIDYLAKDYSSFKQLMLDRLALMMPDWNERHEPDLLITLVELLAYEGDRLSYLQDAVATEAYLRTARRRISVRRHARLVDYRLHEGCNARAFVFVSTSEDTLPMSPDDFFFITRYPDAPDAGTPMTAHDLRNVAPDTYEVYEPLLDPPAPRIDRRAIRRPMELCERILQGKDAPNRYVRDRLSPSSTSALQQWAGKGAPPAELVDGIAADLDRIAHEHVLAYEKAFGDDAGRCRTGEAYQPARSDQVAHHNRRRLEATYPDEIAPPQAVRFYKAHNTIAIYTWGRHDCCIPRGATSAVLIDEGLQLQEGDFLLFEEFRSPTTSLEEDADPHHRHVVRLTRVEHRIDPVKSTSLLEVHWSRRDALPFALCVSARGPAPECAWRDDIVVARGNVLLVDHGRRVVDELDAVEADAIQQPCGACRPEVQLAAAPYAPVLSRSDVTFSVPLDAGSAAAARLVQKAYKALPAVRLQQVPVAPPRLDLPDPLDRYRNPVVMTAFDPEDLIAAAPMLLRLQKASAQPKSTTDLSALFVYGKLDTDAQTALKTYSPTTAPTTKLGDGVLAGLNAVLDDDDFFDPDLFPDTSLDVPTAALRDARPLPVDLRRLFNRWLLELAFGESLAPTKHFVQDWAARLDLIASGEDDRHFVVEMDDRRTAHLRFGDDELGEQPKASTRFRAFYRVGNGIRGNVGAGAIALFVARSEAISGVEIRPRNPLPAIGGVEPERLEEARRRAPHAIRRDLARAVTADDYAAIALRELASDVQGTSGDLMWTGSWYEARVTLDPYGTEDAARRLLRGATHTLEPYRRIGHDLRVAQARYVPLAITMFVCVKPGFVQAHVRAALVDAFRARVRRDGGNGFFHPDNLRFGQSVDVSDLVAVAQAVTGVVWSRVTQLERLGEGPADEIATGTLTLGPTEIARVDSIGGVGSQRGFPEFGSITFEMEGGR